MNLSKLDKSKSMFHEAAQKGKKLRGAELWEIEGGHQNLTRSSNGSEETLMPKKDFRYMSRSCYIMLKIMMMKKMLKSVMKMKWSHDRSPSCANRVAPHNTNSVNLGYF